MMPCLGRRFDDAGLDKSFTRWRPGARCRPAARLAGARGCRLGDGLGHYRAAARPAHAEYRAAMLPPGSASARQPRADFRISLRLARKMRHATPTARASRPCRR